MDVLDICARTMSGHGLQRGRRGALGFHLRAVSASLPANRAPLAAASRTCVKVCAQVRYPVSEAPVRPKIRGTTAGTTTLREHMYIYIYIYIYGS